MVMISELRFSSPDWKFYSQGLIPLLLGVGFLVAGLAGLAFVSWRWTEILFIVGGIFSTVLGIVVIVFVWFLAIYGMITSWRVWRQFRPPAVIVDAEGVRYEASRRPATVPWSDIEQLRVKRTIFPRRVVSSAALRLAPGAALLRAGHTSEGKYLTIGPMSDLAVPEDSALAFLTEVAGPRLEIEEDDRRPAYAARGYR